MPLHQQVEGTALVVGAACVFAMVAVVVHADPLPVLWATELRFLVSWFVSIIFMMVFKRSRGLHWFGPPDSRKWLFLKCFLSFSFIICWWQGLREAPVGNCIAIVYTSPVLTSIFSRVLLDEKLGQQYPFQVILNALGSLMILEPPFLYTLFKSLFAAEAGLPHDAVSLEGPSDYTFVFLALSVASVLPLVTKQTSDCSWIEVEHVSAFLAATVLDPSLLLSEAILTGDFQTGSRFLEGGVKEATMISLAAAGSFLGIAMETKGYQLAQVGKASMFRYVEIPFGYFLQASFTRQPVKPRAFIGSICIMCSCLLGIEWTSFSMQEVDDEEKSFRAPLTASSSRGASKG